MQAMVLSAPHQSLVLSELAKPDPKPEELLIKVAACGVCRTDLHVVDGELTEPKLPIVPGHEIVGIVEKLGSNVTGFAHGQRVGVPWVGGTCGVCYYCQHNQENLCDKPIFTGYTQDGGFAQYATANARYCFPVPAQYTDVELAPLLCAGLIGWRCYKFAGNGQNLGIYGFGAAAHLIAQVAKFQGKQVFAFTSPTDKKAQEFALSLGAKWAGGSDQLPPEQLDAAIIFAPVGALIPAALKATRKGGIVVCGGIHMSDIPSFQYKHLWHERVIRSVANLTRDDAIEFLSLAPKVPVKTTTHTYPLADAQRALDDLRHGRFTGAAVIVP